MNEMIAPYSFCINFPTHVPREIIRDNVIQIVTKKLLSGTSIMFITGEEETGKSTFLAQFAKKNYNNTICVFIKPVNKFSNSIDNILFEIISQIKWIIDKSQLEDNVCSFSLLSVYLSKLIRSSKSRVNYYFLIDGFEHVDSAELYLYEELFQQLPFGNNNFKFIVTDNKHFVRETFLQTIINKGKLKVEENEVLRFSLNETVSYFESLQITLDNTQEILKITEGIAGRIKSIYERLEEGMDFENLFENIDNYTDFLKSQWESMHVDDAFTIKILSLVALEEVGYSLIQIAKIFEVEKLVLQPIVNGLTCLICDENEIVKFRSHYFKRFVKRKLSDNQNLIDEVIIEFHLKNKENIDSILDLPKRFERGHNYAGILDILDDRHFLKIIQKKQSFTFIEDQTLIGISASKELKKFSDYYRLCLQKSAIGELKQTYIWESEIDAKIELKDFDSARQLAELSLLKEDKFRLLTYLARKRKEKGLNLDLDLTETIKALYHQIHPNTFYDSDEIQEISANLLYTLPELAVDFLKNANGQSDSTAADLSFARLAILMKELESKDDEKRYNSITSSIKNPMIRNVTEAFASFHKTNTVQNFLTQMDDINSQKEKIQILRVFISDNTKLNNIELAIDYALDLIITDSLGNPVNANILEDLSSPIPYLIGDKASVLISKLEPFKLLSKERGPTVGHFKFLIHLACGIIKEDSDKARIMFTEIYFEISAVNDIVIKSECLAYMYLSIRRFDVNKSLESLDSLETILLTDIDNNVDQILDKTAHQDELMGQILKTLGKVDPEKAVSFCLKMNIQRIRSKALLKVLKSYLGNDFENLEFIKIDLLFDSISGNTSHSEACVKILAKFASHENVLAIYPKAQRYILQIDSLFSNRDKCMAYRYAVEIVHKASAASSLFLDLVPKIKKFWNSVESKYEKIEYGFRFSTSFLKIDKGISLHFLSQTEIEKKQLHFGSPISVNLYHNLLKLTLLSVSGLIKAGVYSENDIQRVVDYIKNHPNHITQISLISEILEDLNRSGDIQLFTKLYNQYIKPFTQFISSPECNFSCLEIQNSIDAIAYNTFIFNKPLCYHLLDTYAGEYREECYNQICNDLCIGDNEGDDRKSQDLKIDFATALLVLDILEKMTRDTFIVDQIDNLRICSKNHSFTKEESITLREKIIKVIDNKLPDLNNIKHMGYKVLAHAYAVSIYCSNPSIEWPRLVAEAKMIPNSSDLSFVLSIVATLIPPNLNKHNLLTEAISLIDQLPMYQEKVYRYSDLKETVNDINLNNCKSILTKAITESIKENSFNLYRSQKSIIDFAYALDKDFANGLLKIIDDDPARKPLSERLKKNIKQKKIEKDFIEDSLDFDFKEVKTFSQTCQKFTSKLISNRVKAKKLESTIPWLEIAKKRPISETFNIFVAFTINTNIRYESNAQQAKAILIPYFESTLKILQLVKLLSVKVKDKDVLPIQIKTDPSEEHVIVKNGDRQKALDFIKKWADSEIVEYVKICDPYFKPQDLELIKEIFMIKQDISFHILAEADNNGSDIAGEYRKKWNEIFDQEPPEINVVIVGYRNEKGDRIFSPNHDRWYVTAGSGLRVGTSFSSLGKIKNSGISVINSTEAKEIENSIINKYLFKEERYIDNKRLEYLQFDV